MESVLVIQQVERETLIALRPDTTEIPRNAMIGDPPLQHVRVYSGVSTW